MATKNSLRVQKRLLQFNDITFAFGEISSSSYAATFKGDVQNYTNAAHGGYYPSMGDFQKLETTGFEADLAFDFSGIACDEKVRYARYIKRQLAKSGKLFATQYGSQLIWTNARVVSINELLDTPTERDMLRLSVSFELIDGYWRLCSRTRAFLCEYCPENFQDFDPYYCFDTTDLLGQCDETGSSKCIPCEFNLYDPPEFEGCTGKPMCNYSAKELESMFGNNCANRWHIDYSCEKEADFFCFDVPWGHKYRLPSDSNYNEHEFVFCSRTDLPTEFVRIRLSGVFNNPWVEVNGDKVWVKPDTPMLPINGVITFGFGPEIYRTDNVRDGETNAQDVTNRFLRTNTPFFQLNPGPNTIKVGGNMYHKDSYIYIEPVEITF